MQAASARRPNLLQFVALLDRELQLVLRVVQLLPPLLGLALACLSDRIISTHDRSAELGGKPLALGTQLLRRRLRGSRKHVGLGCKARLASCGCGLYLRGCQLVEELLPLELALPPRRERVLHEHLGLQRALLQLLHRASRGALAAQALAIGSS